jgi:hypothetical protein
VKSQCPETQYQFIARFPRFLVIYLGRGVRNRGNIEKDCRPVAFPLSLGIIQCTFPTGTSYQDHLISVISHPKPPNEGPGDCITFLRALGPWIRFDDTGVQAVEKSAALQGNFQEAESSTQTASILLWVVDN